MKKHIICILFAFLPAISSAQLPVTLSSDQGLSNTCIHSLYEDSYKNVWICTQNGLNRYDGNKLNVYHNDARGGALNHDMVNCVLEADPGSILVGTEAGVQVYSYKSDKFKEIPLVNAEGDTISAHIISISKLSGGEIYVCTAGYGVYSLAESDKFARAAGFQTSSPVLQIFEDGKGRVYVLDYEGNIYNKEKEGLKLVAVLPGAVRMTESRQGKFYVATPHDGLFVCSDDSSFRIANEETRNLIITSVKPADDGRLLLCTDGNGIILYDEATQQIAQADILTYEYDFSKSNVKDAIIDFEGNLWAGVYWKGVFVKPNVGTGFRYVGRRSVQKNTLGTNCVTAVTGDGEGALWAATDHCGIYHLSADGKESVHFKPGVVPTMPSTLMSILVDAQGDVWLGSSWSGVMKMNKKTGDCTYLKDITDGGAAVPNAYVMLEDSMGKIWMGTMGSGLFCFNPRNNSLVHYKTIINNQLQYPDRILHNAYIRSLAVRNNSLFVGTAAGIEVFDFKTDGLTYRTTFLFDRYIMDIKFDDAGMLWAATTKGLSSIDLKSEIITSYTTSDGLPVNSTGSLQIVKDKIWIGTDNGLACFKTKEKLFENYTVSDGLQGNEFSKNASYALNGTLYFGGINGLTYFDPADIDKSETDHVPDLRIVDFYVNGKVTHADDVSGKYEISDKWIPLAEKIELAHADNSFSIELSSMSLLNRNVAYLYRINNGDWMALNPPQNIISFVNMPPDTYDISIKAKAYGKLSEEKNITIVIHPAWYRSTPAFLFYVFVFLLICYVIFRQIKQNIKDKEEIRKHEQAEQLNEARIKFFMNISHEIRTPMTLIISPLTKLMKMDDDVERQRNYALIYNNSQRILRLINQLLDVRKIEKGKFKLNYANVELVGFLTNLYELFNDTALKRGIKFSFLHEMSSLNVFIDPQNFDKIVMNLLSNAFKFTPDNGTIVMKLQEAGNDWFSFSVTDSGVGVLDCEKPNIFKRFYSGNKRNGYIGTGIGLNLAKKLVELHKGEICVEDNPEGQGARFVVRIPKALHLANIVENSAVINAHTAAEPPVIPPDDVLSDEKKKAVRYNIVLVEDDEEIRDYLQSELAGKYSVSKFNDGAQAWDFIIKNYLKVDLVISDIMMPVMDGIELCRKIKNNFNTYHIPIIFISAKNEDKDKIEGLNAQADTYITKPFNINILCQKVENLLTNNVRLKGKYSVVEKQDDKMDKIDLISPDERMMERMMKVINENISNPELNVEFIAEKIGISRVHFHRRLKNYTGLTPRDFIRNIRLKQAAKLLAEKRYDIIDVSIAVGFKSVSTFCTCFKAFYGMTPKEYLNRNAKPPKDKANSP